MRLLPRLRRGAVAMLLLGLATAPAVGSGRNWYAIQRDCEQAALAGRCDRSCIAAVERLIEAAPQPQERRRETSSFFRPYVPWALLAALHANCDDLGAARKALKKSLKYGVAEKIDEDSAHGAALVRQVRRRLAAGPPPVYPPEAPAVIPDDWFRAQDACAAAALAGHCRRDCIRRFESYLARPSMARPRRSREAAGLAWRPYVPHALLAALYAACDDRTRAAFHLNRSEQAGVAARVGHAEFPADDLLRLAERFVSAGEKRSPSRAVVATTPAVTAPEIRAEQARAPRQEKEQPRPAPPRPARVEVTIGLSLGVRLEGPAGICARARDRGLVDTGLGTATIPGCLQVECRAAVGAIALERRCEGESALFPALVDLVAHAERITLEDPAAGASTPQADMALLAILLEARERPAIAQRVSGNLRCLAARRVAVLQTLKVPRAFRNRVDVLITSLPPVQEACHASRP